MGSIELRVDLEEILRFEELAERGKLICAEFESGIGEGELGYCWSWVGMAVCAGTLLIVRVPRTVWDKAGTGFYDK